MAGPVDPEGRLQQFLREVFDPSVARPIRRERRRALGFAEGYARALIDAGMLTPERLKQFLDRAKYLNGAGADEGSPPTE